MPVKKIIVKMYGVLCLFHEEKSLESIIIGGGVPSLAASAEHSGTQKLRRRQWAGSVICAPPGVGTAVDAHGAETDLRKTDPAPRRDLVIKNTPVVTSSRSR